MVKIAKISIAIILRYEATYLLAVGSSNSALSRMIYQSLSRLLRAILQDQHKYRQYPHLACELP